MVVEARVWGSPYLSRWRFMWTLSGDLSSFCGCYGCCPLFLLHMLDYWLWFQGLRPSNCCGSWMHAPYVSMLWLACVVSTIGAPIQAPYQCWRPSSHCGMHSRVFVTFIYKIGDWKKLRDWGWIANWGSQYTEVWLEVKIWLILNHAYHGHVNHPPYVFQTSNFFWNQTGLSFNPFHLPCFLLCYFCLFPWFRLM